MSAVLRTTSILLAVLASFVPVRAEDYPHGEMNRDCENCHTAEAWLPLRKPLAFDHAEVGFPLVGSHKKVKCQSCHSTPDFARVAIACADCHRDAHRGEFGYKCESCHVAKSWDNRRQMWDLHSATLFPLTGAHATLDCQACHQENAPFQYALAPIDCVSCHEADYLATTEPDHQSAGFPTDCEICHSTRSWDALGFPDHDALFPISSGPHSGRLCSDCHVVPGNFQVFDCTNCHEHRQSEMDDKHQDVPGYVYESSACYQCHPRGRE